jgi:branched-chain amino acid transport system permease protein
MTTIPGARAAAAPARAADPRPWLLYAAMGVLILATGFVQSWNLALTIVNMGLISAIMALGVNLQWGFAGLFNIGVVGFLGLGGLAAVLVAMPPVTEAWAAGGLGILLGLLLGAATIVALILVRSRMAPGWPRTLTLIALAVGGFILYRAVFDPAAAAVEAVSPAATGYLGGLGLPVLLAWPAGGVLAAAAAWIIAKVALGLRSDYLAIATLGIAEIILAVMRNEDWLARGVKNVVGIPSPVPQAIDLQNNPAFVERAAGLGMDAVTASTLWTKTLYMGLFALVLAAIFVLLQLALHSPWGRMVRAIRDNEVAAEAMGKDVTRRHLQIFVLGSAIIGVAGAMMVTLDGQLTPGSYQPLRFTFLIWVMVIVGGSGNNWGAMLGGFLIWWLWVMVEPIGLWIFDTVSAVLGEGAWLVTQLQDVAAHMRLLTMGVILLLVLRFSPRGLIPER